MPELRTGTAMTLEPLVSVVPSVPGPPTGTIIKLEPIATVLPSVSEPPTGTTMTLEPRDSVVPSVSEPSTGTAMTLEPLASVVPSVSEPSTGTAMTLEPRDSVVPSVPDHPTITAITLEPLTSAVPSVSEPPTGTAMTLEPQASIVPSVTALPAHTSIKLEPADSTATASRPTGDTPTVPGSTGLNPPLLPDACVPTHDLPPTTEQPLPNLSAKDGGYAWVILATVFTINTICAGYIKSFGILYTLILDHYPEASGSMGGLMMGLLNGCRGLMSPVMGAFTVVAGPRVCVICGSLLATTGLLFAVPVNSILYLAATLGALVGIGICTSETPGFLLINEYFDKTKSLANGIRAAGNPLGGMLFAPLVVFLQEQFSLKGAFIISAGIMLQMVVLGALMRPFELHERIVKEKNRAKSNMNSATDRRQSSIARPNKKPLEFRFLINPAYLAYLVTVLCLSSAMPSALLYMPMYGKMIGLTTYQNAILASYTSLLDFFARLSFGWVTNKKKITKKQCFLAGSALGGLGCLVMPLCSQMWHMIVAASLFCFLMAAYWTQITVLLSDHFGAESMSTTYGFVRMMQGISGFIFPPVIGALMDVSGGLTVPYIMMGSCVLCGAFIYSLLPLLAKLPGSQITLK